MADPLYELLSPYFDQEVSSDARPSYSDAVTATYLTRLTALSLGSLTSTEPASLTQSAQSVLRSLQALSKRSHRSVINATDHLSNLPQLLLALDTQSEALQDQLPTLEDAANQFARKYDRNTENVVLDRRKKAMLLNGNVDRIGNILELPTLLSSTIGSSAAAGGVNTTTGGAAGGYVSALDIYAHVKRLKALYPDSELVNYTSRQADEELQNLISALIVGLQSPALKLAGAMRTIGWLRRVAPELSTNDGPNERKDGVRDTGMASRGNEEGSLGSLFLVCRLAMLRRTLSALDPLKELADQESDQVGKQSRRETPDERRGTGTQTERYLKRFIEIFREQSFAIISMYKSIFPTALPLPLSDGVENRATSTTDFEKTSAESDGEIVGRLPSALATFTPCLVDLLLDTLRQYLPNVTDRSSRDSLLTQVLYCAGSLGRLGADFGMMLAIIEAEVADHARQTDDVPESTTESQPEWVQVMKKHRVQASRLELLSSGVGSSRKGGAKIERRPSPGLATAT